MKKVLLLFLLLSLAACGSETVTETAVNEPETAAATAVKEAVDHPSPDLVPATGESASPTAAPASDEITPATTPAEADIVRSRDYVIGASDPAVTIIEYGDFQ